MAGSGPALILVHGLGVSGDLFIRNLGVLGRRFTVVAPDLVGHGFTDAVDFRGAAPQTVAVQSVLRLADHLGIEAFSIAGSSYGALIAGLAHFHRPDRVRDLVLIGSGSVFLPASALGANLQAAITNATVAMGSPTLDGCRTRLGGICLDPASVPEEILLTQLTSYAQPDRFETYKKTIAGMLATADSPKDQLYGRLEAITARTLVMVGGDDPRATVASHRAGRERIPGARLMVFRDCGHMPFIEHAALFNASLADFLAGEEVGD